MSLSNKLRETARWFRHTARNEPEPECKASHIECAVDCEEAADEIEIADARIAELERECSQWREELRIYRDTESKRIAELDRAVTVRDTEIARLETDLELARREVNRLREALDQSALEYADLSVSAKSLEDHLHALVEVSEDSTIALARAALNGDDDDEETEARAGNGGE